MSTVLEIYIYIYLKYVSYCINVSLFIVMKFYFEYKVFHADVFMFALSIIVSKR